MTTDQDDVAARWREGLTRTAARAYEAAHGNPIPDTSRGVRMRIAPKTIAAVAVALGVVALLVLWTLRPSSVEAVPVVATSASPQAAAEVWVHVSGAVTAPGLMSLPAGSRVADAVDAAGGLAAGAEESAVNLARILNDGEQIFIPREGESDGPGKININGATAKELESLPGVGPVLAERIVTNRETEGGFASLEDLERVSGVGPSVLEAISAEATV